MQRYYGRFPDGWVITLFPRSNVKAGPTIEAPAVLGAGEGFKSSRVRGWGLSHFTHHKHYLHYSHVRNLSITLAACRALLCGCPLRVIVRVVLVDGGKG